MKNVKKCSEAELEFVFCLMADLEKQGLRLWRGPATPTTPTWLAGGWLRPPIRRKRYRSDRYKLMLQNCQDFAKARAGPWVQRPQQVAHAFAQVQVALLDDFLRQQVCLGPKMCKVKSTDLLNFHARFGHARERPAGFWGDVFSWFCFSGICFISGLSGGRFGVFS